MTATRRGEGRARGFGAGAASGAGGRASIVDRLSLGARVAFVGVGGLRVEAMRGANIHVGRRGDPLWSTRQLGRYSRPPMVARQLLVVVAVLATIAVNGLANALPLNGQLTGSVAARYDVLFVPAGYVFSIWGLIYLLLLAYAGYQVLPRAREDARLRRVDLPVLLSCVANGAWLFAWHYERFALSMVLMLALLASLIWAYLGLDIGRAARARAGGWVRRACVELPISVYLGWITVATIANATVVLRHFGWGGWGLSDFTWLVVMLAAAVAIAAAVAWTRRDLAYLAVLIWAFVGIALERGDQPRVVLAAGLAAGLVALALLASALRPLPAQTG